MQPSKAAERFEGRLVTCTLEVDDRIVVVEHVPARVDVDTGERLFSPATVERLQQTIGSGAGPSRTVETPVYEFAARVGPADRRLPACPFAAVSRCAQPAVSAGNGLGILFAEEYTMV